MTPLLKRTLFTGVIISVAASAVASGPQTTTQAAREQQWVYRDVLGTGDAQPTAAFLSWDYSSVVFTAKCDTATRELVIRAALDIGPDAPPLEPIEVSSNSLSVKLRTAQIDGTLEGRTKVTRELSTILRAGGDLEVFIPSEMGEPLYVGHAGPFRRIGLMCGS